MVRFKKIWSLLTRVVLMAYYIATWFFGILFLRMSSASYWSSSRSCGSRCSCICANCSLRYFYLHFLLIGKIRSYLYSLVLCLRNESTIFTMLVEYLSLVSILRSIFGRRLLPRPGRSRLSSCLCSVRELRVLPVLALADLCSGWRIQTVSLVGCRICLSVLGSWFRKSVYRVFTGFWKYDDVTILPSFREVLIFQHGVDGVYQGLYCIPLEVIQYPVEYFVASTGFSLFNLPDLVSDILQCGTSDDSGIFLWIFSVYLDMIFVFWNILSWAVSCWCFATLDLGTMPNFKEIKEIEWPI